MMDNLTSLPIELLRTIADCVSTKFEEHIADLLLSEDDPESWVIGEFAALSLTNRHLHQIFNPLLYHWNLQRGSQVVSWAITNGRVDTLEKVVATGFNLNLYVKSYYHSRRSSPPVFYALTPGLEPVLEWLLQHGARPDLGEPLGNPLRLINPDDSALYAAIQQKQAHAALILLDHDASILFTDLEYEHDWSHENQWEGHVETALHEAASVGLDKVVERLLLDNYIGVNTHEYTSRTPLHVAASSSQANIAVIKMLIQHGADMHATSLGHDNPLDVALEYGHSDNVIALLDSGAALSTSPPTSSGCAHCLYDCLVGIGNRDETVDFDILKVICKLIELGADLEKPLSHFGEERTLLELAVGLFEPDIFEALLKAGADPLKTLRGGRTIFNLLWMDDFAGHFSEIEQKTTLLLEAGARMDIKDQTAGQTAFEAAMDMCDDINDPQCESLEFLLHLATPSTIASGHVYSVLEYCLAKPMAHLAGCITITDCGWISKRAQEHMFDWLLSYISGIKTGSHVSDIDWGATTFNTKAANYFISYIARNQLEDLWKRCLILRKDDIADPSGMVECPPCREISIHWLHVAAERGDIEAVNQLLADGFQQDVYDISDHTPIMRAILGGHKDVVLTLLQHGVTDQDVNLVRCFHAYRLHTSIDEACPSSCKYGQRSVYELAVSQGEIDILETMWNHRPILTSEWKDYQNMPRVFSYGNLVAEWMQLRLDMQEKLNLEISGKDSFSPLEIQDRLSKLRMEIIEIRDGCKARFHEANKNKENFGPYS